MEQPSSSSKVTVEYYDPSNVYQLLKPGLLPRLPLRNLHWDSHAGPLRSIDTLHVDLVPAEDDAPLPYSVDSSSLSRVRSTDSGPVGDDGFRAQPVGQGSIEKERPESSYGQNKPVKERRHQIPGLRQTPYLKVLLLRCDDNDIYKATSRRQVRDWIKEHAAPAQKSTAAENHDAFEWLILHVIVPNTAAATQPRTSGKSSDSASGAGPEKPTVRWRGGGSSTIFEKLRADFNGSSKPTVDRIAQIRIGINDVPYDILPRVVPAIPGSYTETAQDHEVAWADLISKMKSLILASFDMRVTQYEEDIKEKDGQRTLPGWNFCTFFMLKEGLARGFESVGLVDDALVGYDELSIGLDAILRGQSVPSSATQPSSTFLPYTEDLRRQVANLRSAMNNDRETSVEDMDGQIDMQLLGNREDEDEIPLIATKKKYRELIMSNNISVFDFRCYIFSRQLSLLLRLGNAWSSRDELLAKLKEQHESSLKGVAARTFKPEPTEVVENMVMLAEVCRRSLDFMASISRIMRDDMIASQANPGEDSETRALEDDPEMLKIIDNVVASFTFSVAQQILAQTSTKSLPIPQSTLAPSNGELSLNGHEQKASIPEPKTMMHPARNSSLALMPAPSSAPMEVFPTRRAVSASFSETKSDKSVNFLKAGIEELAAHRADLYMLSRNVLEDLGKIRGWPVGWGAVKAFEDDDLDYMEEIDLDGDETGNTTPTLAKEVTPASFYGISSKLLRTAIDNKDDFYRLYETLTEKALRHYTVANRTQSAQANLADLAVLKFHMEDYAAAAFYFYRMTPLYGDGGWEHIEMCSLALYAKCLKQLDRKDEYVRVLSKLLMRKASKEKERIARKFSVSIGKINSAHAVSSTDDLTELIRTVAQSGRELHIPLMNWFGEVEVGGGPQYHDGQDSFALGIRLRYLLHEEVTIDRARMRITRISGGNHPYRDIWLENETPVLCKGKMLKIQLTSNVIVPGTYVVRVIILKVQNVTLDYEVDPDMQHRGITGAFLKASRLLLYQRAEAFDVTLYATKSMHLDRHRLLELEISSGWNDIASGEIRLRAATAGLRLRTSEIEVVSGALEIKNNPDAGVIQFGTLAAGLVTKLRFPFNLEREVPEISIKLDSSFTTDKGTFLFATNPVLSISLPLGVNVQDVFKHSALFSKFTVSTANSSPLRLIDSKLESSEIFDAHSSGDLGSPVMVFQRQAASLVYKITPKSATTKSPTTMLRKEQRALSLIIHYICLEEEINTAIKMSLGQALENSPLHQFSRLITSTVIARFHKQAETQDLERTALLGALPTGIIAQTRWKELFAGSGRMKDSTEDTATLVAQWLQKFLKENPRIPLLPVSSILETERRSIIIPVEIPNVTVVHTADLVISKPSSPIPSSGLGINIAAVNEPLPVTLQVKWSRIWDLQLSTPRRDSRTASPVIESDSMEFVYEITAPIDTWLIGGRRKVHFRIPSKKPTPDSTEPAELEFPILLIPLKEGYLPCPVVDIKPAPISTGAGADVSGGAGTVPSVQSAITCETDVKNTAETIRVVADVRSTTVSLDASGPSGGVWLIEGERRDGDGVAGEVLL